MDKKKADEICRILDETYPDAKPALQYTSVYELLVAVILSAQCTDVRVNLVTAELFKEHNTPQTMVTLTQGELERYIYSCGFYRAKAAHILSASRDILQKFDGQVPSEIADLRSLSGVGEKTANVVYSVGFGGDAIAVDTHVFRVSNRLGLAKAENVEKTGRQLREIIDRDKWSKAHHWLIWHGRRICSSRAPKCGLCPLNALCEHRQG